MAHVKEPDAALCVRQGTLSFWERRHAQKQD